MNTAQALGLVSGAKTGGATATQAEAALVTSALLVLGIAVMRGVFTIHSGNLITRGMLDIEGVRRFIETGISGSSSPLSSRTR